LVTPVLRQTPFSPGVPFNAGDPPRRARCPVRIPRRTWLYVARIIGELENCRFGTAEKPTAAVRKTGWKLRREVMGDCFEATGDVVMVRQRGEEIAGRCIRVRRARRAIGESNWDILGGVSCAICFSFRCREYRDRIELAGGSRRHVIGWVGVALLVSPVRRRSWPRCFSLPEHHRWLSSCILPLLLFLLFYLLSEL
jgi:hypothetical protein